MKLFRLLGSAGLVMMAAVAVSGGLSGCAASGPQTNQAATAARGDIVTASDETGARKRARIRLELASTYYAQGQYPTALDELKQALTIDPTLPSAYEMRALIYDAMGDNTRAEESFKEAVSRDAHNGSALHNYAWHLCRLGQYAQADALFERAAALPQTISTSKTLLARGVCQIKAGHAAAAEAILTRSFELDSANPATAYNLAVLLYQRGALERARFYIHRVNDVTEQRTAESLWLGIRIENKLNNVGARDELAAQLRRLFPYARETTVLELGRFDD